MEDEERGLVIVAQDKFVRLVDLRSGKEVNSFVAHTDTVTCLERLPPTSSTSPLTSSSSSFLYSSSHDGSLRVWDLSNNSSCLFDTSIHRKKWDESIHSLKFHPTFHYLCSASADSTIKCFQN